MSESIQRNAETAATGTASKKAAYAKPTLRLFGSVSELTKGAGGTGTDMMSQIMVSDRSVKENIVQIGTHPMGFGLYLFDYKATYKDAHGHGRMFGVMADEVESVMPDAVVMRSNGYRAVNYAMLGISHA